MEAITAKRYRLKEGELVYSLEPRGADGYGITAYLHELRKEKCWKTSFYTRSNFSCCGTMEAFAFSFNVPHSVHDTLWVGGRFDKLSEEEITMFKVWIKELLPYSGLDTFSILPLYRVDDVHAKAMNQMYSAILEAGKVVEEFKNPNSGNLLRLVRFPHKENDEFKETR